jgi:hypothetical protein
MYNGLAAATDGCWNSGVKVRAVALTFTPVLFLKPERGCKG